MRTHSGADTDTARRGIAVQALARLPAPLVVKAGRAIGMFWYTALRTHRLTVLRNLAFAFPEWPAARVRATARRVFQHFGITLVEILQLSVRTREEVVRHCRIEGLQHAQAAVTAGKGALFISAHLGNWEIGLQAVPCRLGKPVLAVAKELKHRLLNDWLHRTRSGLGNRIIYKKGAFADLSETLRRGEIAAMHVDMSRSRDGIDISFFGRRATATPAAALLARRRRSPVLPVICNRDPDGAMHIQIGTPLALVKTSDLRADLKTNTQIMTDVIEEAVRRHPDQWWWLQKRWKDHYPGLYPEHFQRRKQHLAARLERKRKLKGKH